MVEFTDEEIEQLCKELKDCESLSNKICGKFLCHSSSCSRCVTVHLPILLKEGKLWKKSEN